jgi:tRNA pseudouridine13 synthase
MSTPTGRPAELEATVLAEEGHAAEAFTRHGPLQWQGGRRPLRFPLGEVASESGTDEHGEFLELAFTLPPGCYATSVLRELVSDAQASTDSDEDDDLESTSMDAGETAR